MKNFNLKHLLLFIFLITQQVFSQSITGFVYDESNNPIPYAKVYLKNQENTGAITDLEGKYFVGCEMGSYIVIYKCTGFDDLEIQVTVDGVEPTVQNIFLKQSNNELDKVEIKEKRRNVGWLIVQNVIDHKKEMIRQYDGYTCDIYIKGVETFEQKKKKEDAEEKEEVDPLLAEQKEMQKKLDEAGRLNMVEVNLTKHFQYPNQIKEIRNGYETVGRPNQIYFQSTVSGDFNFYESLISKEDLHLGPIVSPLHPSGILSYKYKLTEINTVGNDTIYTIKISSRSVGTSTLTGKLYIKKNDWVLTKVDLSMRKGNLKVYDDFRIIQEFEQSDSLWLMTKQTFEYSTKYGKETVHGTTDVTYTNYSINPIFPKKFFSNEVGITTEEAYERDSTYWDEIRPTPLTAEQQRSKFVQDSIMAIYNSEEYLDSVAAVVNKITVLKVLALGIRHVNREKKSSWYLSSLAELVQPTEIGGLRIGPYYSYYKRFESEQTVRTWSNLTLGYNNTDLRGNFGVYHHYNPKKLAQYFLSAGRSDRMINWNNSISSLLNRQNIYLNTSVRGSHYFEIINGLYLFNSFDFSRRTPFKEDYKFVTWFDDLLQETKPIQFEPYNALRTEFYLSYTPAQKYLTEPKRKVVLGSAWPTFTIGWEKGWKGPFKSVVDFDYLYFAARQTFQIRTFGQSRYNLNLGTFVNQDSVFHIDKKFFRQADVNRFLSLAFVDPLNNFQNLDSSYQTQDLYLEAHYIHHFNGAIMNKIPFMKKTGIKTLVGSGFIFLPEHDNYFYTEAYLGVERIFKVLRERIRIGAYVIVSTSSNQFKLPDEDQPRNLKFALSFDVMSSRNQDFNF